MNSETVKKKEGEKKEEEGRFSVSAASNLQFRKKSIKKMLPSGTMKF